MDAGYADRLCPSHDLVQARIMVAHPEISEDERLRLNPHGYLYIQKEVYPMLREMVKSFLQFRLRSRRPSEYSRLRHSLQSCESLVRALRSHEIGYRFFHDLVR